MERANILALSCAFKGKVLIYCPLCVICCVGRGLAVENHYVLKWNRLHADGIVIGGSKVLNKRGKLEDRTAHKEIAWNRAVTNSANKRKKYTNRTA